MRYIQLEQPMRADPNGVMFLHAIEFMMRGKRYKEFEEFVTNIAGEKHTMWRVQARALDREWSVDPENGNTYPEKFVVRFAEKDHAMMFKLSWEPCIPTPATNNFDRVILPIIRRAQTKALANEIIGVQPMTGPVNLVHSLKVVYDVSDIKVHKSRYTPPSENAVAMEEWEDFVSTHDAAKLGIDITPSMSPEEIKTLVLSELEREAARLNPSKKSSTDTSGNDQ